MPFNAERIQAVFLAASEIEGPAGRAAFLDGACDGDAELRARVEALLRAHDQPDTLLDQPAVVTHDPDSESTVAVGHEGGGATGDEAPLWFLAPSTRPDSLGRIGHYEVLQVLGQGGFGIVFRAFDDVLHRVVAVKVLSPQTAATSPARKRFLREARSSARVRHENVVQVYEVGETPLPYIAMEFIPGETLQQRLDRTGPLDVVDVVRIGRQLAEGLVAAHAADLIHRDIKPANILLEGGQLRVKITDFGLARAADDASISRSGLIAGSPMFMAPEQAKGETLDRRADLFSLGSVLYVMVTGRPPFRASGTLAVLKRVAEDTPRPIREIIPETPRWLCDLIANLHTKSPADRFQSAREVADVLADCEAQLEVNARLRDFSRIPRARPRTAKRSGGRGWIAAAILFLLVVILAATESAGVTQLFRGRQATDDPIKGADNRRAREPAGWHGWPVGAPAPAIAPFNAEQARVHQETWAAYLGVPVEYTNGLGMTFVLVPPGEFTMGSSSAEIKEALTETEDQHAQDCIASESPRHTAILTEPIYLGIREISRAEYETVMEDIPPELAKERHGEAPREYLPAGDVGWQDAPEFCARLSRREQLNPPDSRSGGAIKPLNRPGYRLPSEAQWEFACRAGTVTRFSSGEAVDDLARVGWFRGNSDERPHAAGELGANAFGLFDLHGNVWEWVQDAWDRSFYAQFRDEPAVDPICPYFPGALRVMRGGSCFDPASWARSSCRGAYGQKNDLNTGFRVALPVDEAKALLARRADARFTDAEVRRISAMPAEQQVAAVSAKLKDLNPGFDGKVEHKMEEGVVTVLRINTDRVTDISPIRVFDALRTLDLGGTHTDRRGNSRLTDLTPLKGMSFGRLTYLNLAYTKVIDAGLELFKDCKELANLLLDRTQVTDAGLAYFKDCKSLKGLHMDDTQVTDAGLVDIAGLNMLAELAIRNTKVTAKGIEDLAKVLTKCKITWDGGVTGPK